MPRNSKATASPDAGHVKALRRFNRFYTQRMGILSPYLDSALSLSEVRVLYELAHYAPEATEPLTATQLAQQLGLDHGYLSRILHRFEARLWVARSPKPGDARHSMLTLTQAGHSVFAPLQQKSRDEAGALLGTLSHAKQARMIAAMGTIEHLFTSTSAKKAKHGATVPEAPYLANSSGNATDPSIPAITLRDPRPGDMGWVVAQHGEIYAREYGWNMEFEALVAEIVVGYVRRFQPEWERCWMAEVNGQRVGCVFVVRKSKTVAQLRMLILTPEARGHGLGARLTDECLAFARSKGYKKMVLWTNSCLLQARAIYTARGFVLKKCEPYAGFGKRLTSETWELVL